MIYRFIRFHFSLTLSEHLSDEDFVVMQRVVILMYDRSSECYDVNECRKELFTKKGRPVEGIPPTSNALRQHILRALLQARYEI